MVIKGLIPWFERAEFTGEIPSTSKSLIKLKTIVYSVSIVKMKNLTSKCPAHQALPSDNTSMCLSAP